METRLDRFGRVVLPKEIRDELALEPGDALEVRATTEGILLSKPRPAGDHDCLRTVDGVLVFDGTPSGDVSGAGARDRQARTDNLSGGLGGRSRKRSAGARRSCSQRLRSEGATYLMT